jgi:hypothetical protein
MENEILLNLTENEARVLINLIDLAVKAHGLSAAEAGVILSKKINAAVNKQNQFSTTENVNS